jgi:hypothetical protein
MEDDKSAMDMPPSKRRMLFNLIGVAMLQPLAACGKGMKMMPKEYGFDVLVRNFIDRTLLDVRVNGKDVGIAWAMGMSGVVGGVPIAMGPQTVTWRFDAEEGTPNKAGTGSMKNVLIVKESDIPKDAVYLGVYIYPDNTVEYQFSEHLPRNTERGTKILKARSGNG